MCCVLEKHVQSVVNSSSPSAAMVFVQAIEASKFSAPSSISPC